MKLTKRLQVIADLVQNQTGIIADVGTDHALIPIYLAKKFPERKIYALDVRTGPLEKAKKNAKDFRLSDRIEFKLSDGLKVCLNEKISSIIIAGMGGIIMENILQEGVSCYTQDTELILSPQSDRDLVRKCLHRLGFCIRSESYVKEAGKIYLIIYAGKGQDASYSEAEYHFGKSSVTKDKAILQEFRQMEWNEMQMISEQLATVQADNEQAIAKKEEIARKMSELKKLMECQ